MLIYKITSPNTDIVYVGKTTATLRQRLWGHHSQYKGWLAGKPNISNCTSFKVLEHGDATIELIEETDDASREYHWINAIDNTCNVVRGRPLFDHAAYHRARYAENKEEINAKENQREPCLKCGRIVNHSNMARHQRTKVCQDHAV